MCARGDILRTILSSALVALLLVPSAAALVNGVDPDHPPGVNPPQDPQPPRVPDADDIPDVPGVERPGIPGVNLPQDPRPPGLPDADDIPDVPGIERPGIPGVNLPQDPQPPRVPDADDIPDVPGVELPSVPGLNGPNLTALGNATNVTRPDLANTTLPLDPSGLPGVNPPQDPRPPTVPSPPERRCRLVPTQLPLGLGQNGGIFEPISNPRDNCERMLE